MSGGKPTKISSGNVGAASELMACAHLLTEGYHVFRSESPNCPFDLVAYRNGEMLRIEVKTLNRTGPAALSYPRPGNNEWDRLVLVDYESQRVFVIDPDQVTTHHEIYDILRDAYGMPPALEKFRARVSKALKP